MEVRAAFAEGPHRALVIDTVELDAPRHGEVLIRMHSAGLCHTDLMLFDGTWTWDDYPIVLGHEGSGTVAAVGPGVTRLSPGDKIIPLSMPECGRCAACLSDRTNLCELFLAPNPRRPFRHAGRAMPAFSGLGTFAEYAVVREVQVARIPEAARLGDVCCLDCAAITGIGSVTYGARVTPGASMVVFGLGGIGLNVVDGGRLAEAGAIVGVDRNRNKEAAGRRAGMTHFIDASDPGTDVVSEIARITGGGADFSFECVGHPAVLQQALDCTRSGWGMTVSIGVMPGSASDTIPLRWRSLRGRTLTSVTLGNMKSLSQFPELVAAFIDGKLANADLISHRIGLDEINEGFALLKSGQARRIVVDF